jgi:hypothetical protein
MLLFVLAIQKGELLPDKQGRFNNDRPANLYVASPDACEGDGTDWVAAAFDVTVVSCYTAALADAGA